MANGAARVLDNSYIDSDPALLERINRESDIITADYNNIAVEEYYLNFDEPQVVTRSDELSESEKQFAREKRHLQLWYSICIMFAVASFCLCMFMMVKGVAAQDELDKHTSALSALQQESVRLENEIKGRCEIAAVADYVAEKGLRKASQFQTIYVGGKSENSGIVTNASPDQEDSGLKWGWLKSFFD